MMEIALFMLIFGIILFSIGLLSLKKKRLIENTPTSKVRSLAMGPVEVFGKVVPSNEHILTSPFSGKKCVYYKYFVQEYRRSGKHSYWATIKKGADLVPFFIDDGTGTVLIDPKGSDLDIPKSFTWQTGFGKNPPKIVTEFLESQGMSMKSFFGFNKKMRFTEYIVLPETKVYVFGTAGDNPYVEDATAKKNTDDIMITKGSKGSFFYISDKDEKSIVSKFKWKIFGGLLVGSALIVLGAIITLINFRLW